MNISPASAHQSVGFSIDNAQRLDLSNAQKIHIAEADPKTYNQFMDNMTQLLESTHSTLQGKPDNHPDNLYAEVVKNGQVIATLYNSGAMQSSNAVANTMKGQLNNDGHGPDLAQRRAEQVANTLGGEIQIKETALTQTAHLNQPKASWQLDKNAMQADPLYANLLKIQVARQEFLNQQKA
ncbi:MAG: hypothetical protein CL693_03070 [Cellvibrionaceae bacterium]|nr:hypothetical protein [Cellvibrionaceae bacterium]|tara:strand:+ start:37301 stop:37843 length:543 start_codon:yes stop_codon:yes gene_type:complete